MPRADAAVPARRVKRHLFPRHKLIVPRPQTLRGVDAALSELRTRLPEFLVYTMGEAPLQSRPRGGPFFCGIEARAGGTVFTGHASTLAGAIERALVMAEEQHRRSLPASARASGAEP